MPSSKILNHSFRQSRSPATAFLGNIRRTERRKAYRISPTVFSRSVGRVCTSARTRCICAAPFRPYRSKPMCIEICLYEFRDCPGNFSRLTKKRYFQKRARVLSHVNSRAPVSFRRTARCSSGTPTPPSDRRGFVIRRSSRRPSRKAVSRPPDRFSHGRDSLRRVL